MRYYQRIAIQRAVEAILKGQNRLLLTLATGTGKTEVVFQVCWKLTQARWNRAALPILAWRRDSVKDACPQAAPS